MSKTRTSKPNHDNLIQRLYFLMGSCEGALAALADRMAKTQPEVSKNCARLVTDIQNLWADMEAANLGWTVREYTQTLLFLSSIFDDCLQGPKK